MLDSNTPRRKNYLPLAFALVLAGGLFLGARLNVPFTPERSIFSVGTAKFDKLTDVLSYIQQEYVDTVDREQLVNASIEKMLQTLDPHSAYIPAEDFNAANEPLEGNFEGIGVEFHIQSDTIMVVTPISGGPAESVGIRSGDRFVIVEDTLVAGVGITNDKVMQMLRGTGGTKVRIKVYRRGVPDLINFTLTRGKIPIYSIDVAFMINDSSGYMKVSRFAANTYEEFMQAAQSLKKRGMKHLVLDLRSNPGGYLDAATKMADEFLEKKKTIVYTEGKARPRTNYESTAGGEFEQTDVIILIDEGSASASEIVAGALQDWDRATIVGRRSFGKGLVQEQIVLPDGSALRLTIARYYTPTGRSIQKPYQNGFDEYNNELMQRFDHSELISADSIRFTDSLKFTTPGGKIVYGGGGIMPDVFVPIDTAGQNNQFLIELMNSGLIYQFVYDYVDDNRSRLKTYKTFKEYESKFEISTFVFEGFLKKVKAANIEFNSREVELASYYIKKQMKAHIGRQLFRNEGFFPVLLQDDKTFLKAMELLKGKPVN